MGVDVLVLGTITEQIIGAAIEVHKALGPGLLESVYEACMAHDLENRKIPVLRQFAMGVIYKGVQIDVGYRADLLVANQIIVELKSVERIQPIHEAQLLTYLRATQRLVGLIINFNTLRLRDGIVRRVVSDRLKCNPV